MAATLTRALTKRINKMLPEDSSEQSSKSRGFSMSRKQSIPSSSDRIQISLPVELVSATNPLAYDAPDLRNTTALAPLSTDTASTHSGSESINTPALSSSASVSSHEYSRHGTPVDPLPGHHLPIFDEPTKPFAETTVHSNVSSDSEAPMVPRRALSHTKRTHQALARQRSHSRLSAERSSTTSTGVTKARSSVDMFSAKGDAAHPFGAELAKVNEMVEDLGAADVKIYNEEEQYLIDHGLRRFGVEDYLAEIGSLYTPQPQLQSKHKLREQAGGWL